MPTESRRMDFSEIDENDFDTLKSMIEEADSNVDALRKEFLYVQKGLEPTSTKYRENLYYFLWHIDKKFKSWDTQGTQSQLQFLKNIFKGKIKLKEMQQKGSLVLQTLELARLVKSHCPETCELIDNPILSLVLALPHNHGNNATSFAARNGNFTLRLTTKDGSVVPSGRLARMILFYIVKTSWNYSGLYTKDTLFSERIELRKKAHPLDLLKEQALLLSEKGVIDFGSNLNDFLEEIGYRGKQPNRKKFKDTLEGFERLRVDCFHTDDKSLPFPTYS